MSIRVAFAAAVGAMALTSLRPVPADAAEAAAAPHGVEAGAQLKWLEDYCGKCHNATDWAGSVAFDTMSMDTIGDDAKVWEETVRKMRGRLMPPPGEKQPDQKSVD